MRESANVKVQCLLTGKSHAVLPDTNLCMKPFLERGFGTYLIEKKGGLSSLSLFLGEKKDENFFPRSLECK